MCELTISRLLSPTVVRPPPFSVPRWTLTASRKTLPLPTVSLVRAPLYFLSCGAPPTTALGKKTLSRPMVVSPRMVTLLSRRQPAPILTSGPMTQNGPISTSSAISALGSTTACGEIFGESSEKKRNVNSELNHAGRLRGVGFVTAASGGLTRSCSIGFFGGPPDRPPPSRRSDPAAREGSWTLQRLGVHEHEL